MSSATTGRALPTAAVTGKTAQAASSRALTAAADDSADVFAYQVDQADPVAVGGQITYTITVGDNGPTAASGVTLSDTLPTGTTFVSAEPTSGSCSESNGTVTCTFGTISAGGSGGGGGTAAVGGAGGGGGGSGGAIVLDGRGDGASAATVSPVSADLAVLQTDDADRPRSAPT
jgi:uncharacterized repeat protein (TIGR01451 family)